VDDPSLRERLRPTFRMGCKRVLLSNDYYPALQRENVRLVTEGIVAVDERGLVTRDGEHHAFDALIWNTGFHVADIIAPFRLTGRAGCDVAARWEREGAQAYLGTTVAGCPNFYLLFGPNTGLGHNSMVFMIEAQIAYVMGALRTLRQRRLSSLELRRDAQDEYNARLQHRLPDTVWGSGCKSWYIAKSGRNTTVWPGSTVEFWARTRRFDASQYLAVPEFTVGREAEPDAPSAVAPGAAE
jgi:cation diffusion facilitator CzcD-associated flavoprotein CzcO